jgi:hypothetical protein
MSVGITYTKVQLDNAVGSLVIELENALRRCAAMASYLAATPDATLIALGYTQAEVNTLKSAFVTDLTQYEATYRAAATVTPAKDFRAFTGLLKGPGL